MAAGPLAALLAYDLVLTLPLIAHVQVARPQHMTVLVVYIAVLVSSTTGVVRLPDRSPDPLGHDLAAGQSVRLNA